MRKFGLKKKDRNAQDHYGNNYWRNVKRNALAYMNLSEPLFYCATVNMHRLSDNQSNLGVVMMHSAGFSNPLVTIYAEMMDVLYGEAVRTLRENGVNDEDFMLYSNEMNENERYIAGAGLCDLLCFFAHHPQLQKQLEQRMFCDVTFTIV